MADIELTVVVGVFEARSGREEQLAATLAKYVVLTRRRAACRNVDFLASVVRRGRFAVIEKWETPDAQRDHMDAEETVEMASACRDLLSGPPDLDLLDAISAQDLEE